MGVVGRTRRCGPVPTRQVVGGVPDLGPYPGEKAQSGLTSCLTGASFSTRGDPWEVRHPPPTSGGPSSRLAARLQFPAGPALALLQLHRPELQGLLGVEVLNASPGCRENGKFFCRGGGSVMPGSQGAAGERNDVPDLERPLSPKSLGGRRVGKRSPCPGDRWARLGYTQVF